MAHFFSATLFLSSSVSFLSCLKLFDIDMSKWDEVLACQSLYKQDLRAASDLKNFQFHYYIGENNGKKSIPMGSWLLNSL